MAGPMPNPSDQELLQHSAFVRRLAHHLLGDVEAAEDVAQDTLLTAIERPPHDGARLKSWLSTVTRRRAYRHLRDQDLRRRKLESLAGPDTPESPDSIAERRAVLGRVTAAVQALDDVYLEAVLMRYFDGLTPTEIATRLNVPLATVSSRLQRALAKLRVRLDDEGGVRWRASLAAAVGLPPSLGKVSTVSSHATLLWSLIMAQGSSGVALGVAVLAVLLFGGYLFFSSDSSTVSNVSSTASANAVAEPRSTADSDVTAIAERVDRESVAPKSATELTRLRLVVTLQWEDGTPARAQRATLRGDDGARTEPVHVSSQRSAVEFAGLAAGAYVFRIFGSSREYPLRIATGPVERRTIELTPVTEFRGRVSTTAGSPVAGAWIVGDGGDVVAESDARGTFRVRSLGKFRTFACRAQSYAASDYRPVPGDDEEVQVFLTPGGAVLEGWVTDPDNEPVAFTDVRIGKPHSGEFTVTSDGTRVYQSDRVRVRTNAEGYFFAVGLRPGEVPLRVFANGSAWSDWNQRIDVTAGATQVVRIRLQRACSVIGLVRDRAGAPAERARVEVRWGAEIDQRDQIYTDEAGRFRLQNLPPGPVVLTAQSSAKGQCRERIVLRPGHDAEWRPFLHLGTVGRVVDSQGQPVGGVRVVGEAPLFEAVVTTDPNGEFSISECPDSLTSLYVIEVREQERVLGHWSHFDVLQHGLFLRLPANAGVPCKVSVRVLGPDGRPVEDVRLSLGEPGEPARIGSGAPDDEGWIRLSGPIYGVRFAATIRSESLGRISLGVSAPDAEGVLDFGTVRMQEPGRLDLQVRPRALQERVGRFVIETLDGAEIMGGAGVPVSGLRLAPGDYRVKLIDERLEPAAVEFSIASERVTNATLQVEAPRRGGHDRR